MSIGVYRHYVRGSGGYRIALVVEDAEGLQAVWIEDSGLAVRSLMPDEKQHLQPLAASPGYMADYLLRVSLPKFGATRAAESLLHQVLDTERKLEALLE